MEHDLLPIPGIKLASTSAGIYKNKRDDITLFQIDKEASVAAVFTKNIFAAAPVVIAKKHLSSGVPIQYLLINAGNANAGLGERGEEYALETCKAVSDNTNSSIESILPFSTGVIGERFPFEKINNVIPYLTNHLNVNGWQDSAKAIMTTDTVAKAISSIVTLSGKTVTITGIAKGSGMIKPNMATMLAFIGTDAAINTSTLQNLLKETANMTFNRITVDGDTSTNDACVLIATGLAKNEKITSTSSTDYDLLKQAVFRVCEHLARSIIKDGEGATKFIEIVVKGGKSQQVCLEVAYTIAHSPLVKTAFFASDPNWGRILAAIGRVTNPDFEIGCINIFLDNVCIVESGARSASYTEEQGIAIMSRPDIRLTVELGKGECEESVWTTDLSHEYVSINADYRS
jgi:glutamate N-acetyltransferase/amino-acid N-acetyltransferase